MFRRALSWMTGSALAMMGASVSAPHVVTHPQRRSRPLRRLFPQYGSGRYRPHQGERERARRRGGIEWAEFRARDRIRRGLPVSWVFDCLR
jgi:hypothetical protein